MDTTKKFGQVLPFVQHPKFEYKKKSFTLHCVLPVKFLQVWNIHYLENMAAAFCHIDIDIHEFKP